LDLNIKKNFGKDYQNFQVTSQIYNFELEKTEDHWMAIMGQSRTRASCRFSVGRGYDLRWLRRLCHNLVPISAALFSVVDIKEDFPRAHCIATIIPRY